jgi:hypothetical protein
VKTPEQVASEVFDSLEYYERGQLAAWGTAFTTYEDYGDEVCEILKRKAMAWRHLEEMLDAFKPK